MAGYIGTKAALLSTTTASVGGDSTVGGDLTVDTDTLYVDSTNNRVGIGNTSPTQALDVTGDIVTSGGVYLGGTGSANKLDQYEIGSWTPTFGWSHTMTDGVGRYVRIGDLVHFQGRVQWSGGSGMNNILQGLPYAASTGDESGYSMTVVPYVNEGFPSLPTGRGYITGYVTNGGSNIEFHFQPLSTSATFLSTGNIYFSGQYRAS